MARLFTVSVFFVLFSSCTNTQDQKRNAFADEIRKVFKEQLKPLPEINYEDFLDRIPSNEELELGRALFSDPILSRNNDVSCATCHLSNHGFADGNSLNVGTMGKGGPTGKNVGHRFGEGQLSLERGLGEDGLGFQGHDFMFRNSLSTVNVVYRIDPTNKSGLFHDGRFGSLFFQVTLPIVTAEEMCGKNPIPHPDRFENIYRAGGSLFSTPVEIHYSHGIDPFTGADNGTFNAQSALIKEIPRYRPNGFITIPNRNECLALAVAKVRAVPKYRQMFQKAYGSDSVTDRTLSMALATFLFTHVSNRTKYDQFLQGKDSLSLEELHGLAIFMTPQGQKKKILNSEITGAGCNNCHKAPEFGGQGFANLGVRSDVRSPLSFAKEAKEPRSGFFRRPITQRGRLPECHIKGLTTDELSGYGPDIGRAGGTFNVDDCFKFRIPPLRNVIETYPYFHHGTERAQGHQTKTLEEKSFVALKNVIKYHLRGPINHTLVNRIDFNKPFFDTLYQKDYLIQYYRQNFHSLDEERANNNFPIKMKASEIDALTKFVAYSLWDKSSVKTGELGNDVSHPRFVPSGFYPTITRDQGNQMELPPNIKKR